MSVLAPPIQTTRSEVTSGWSDPRGTDDHLHKAIDIPAPRGTPVFAAYGGRVVRVQYTDTAPAGKYVVIRHELYPIGVMLSRYLHLDTILPGIGLGSAIRRGQQIGTVGSTGTKYDHLHHDWWVCNAEGMHNWVKLFGQNTGLDVNAAERGECTRVPAETITPVDAFDARVTRLARSYGISLFPEIKLPSRPLMGVGAPVAFIVGASLAGAAVLALRGRS